MIESHTQTRSLPLRDDLNFPSARCVRQQLRADFFETPLGTRPLPSDSASSMEYLHEFPRERLPTVRGRYRIWTRSECRLGGVVDRRKAEKEDTKDAVRRELWQRSHDDAGVVVLGASALGGVGEYDKEDPYVVNTTEPTEDDINFT